jgi:hypothetical protein
VRFFTFWTSSFFFIFNFLLSSWRCFNAIFWASSFLYGDAVSSVAPIPVRLRLRPTPASDSEALRFGRGDSISTDTLRLGVRTSVEGCAASLFDVEGGSGVEGCTASLFDVERGSGVEGCATSLFDVEGGSGVKGCATSLFDVEGVSGVEGCAASLYDVGGFGAEGCPATVLGSGLSVTSDGANSWSSITNRLIGHIPVDLKPFTAFPIDAALQYAVLKNPHSFNSETGIPGLQRIH